MHGWKISRGFSMINLAQFDSLICRVLFEEELNKSEEAVALLLGTAAVESDMGTYIRQIKGRALSPFQIEEYTFDYLNNRYSLNRGFEELEWDLRLAIVVARLKYYSIPVALPKSLQGLAEYWKKYYNTASGSGTVEDFLIKCKIYGVRYRD